MLSVFFSFFFSARTRRNSAPNTPPPETTNPSPVYTTATLQTSITAHRVKVPAPNNQQISGISRHARTPSTCTPIARTVTKTKQTVALAPNAKPTPISTVVAVSTSPIPDLSRHRMSVFRGRLTINTRRTSRRVLAILPHRHQQTSTTRMGVLSTASFARGSPRLKTPPRSNNSSNNRGITVASMGFPKTPKRISTRV